MAGMHPYSIFPSQQFSWQLRTRALPLGRATRVMGILNVTPDSFSDGGRFGSVTEAVEAALAMFAAGAAIVDIGGQTTRPGTPVIVNNHEQDQQEMDRVSPVIEGVLRAKPDALLSIDTYRARVAKMALEAGVEIVNDVSGFLWDEAMAETCASEPCGVVLMHTRGMPQEWKSLPALDHREVVPLVSRELGERLAAALDAGISPSRIVLDPGFGFGKSFDNNYPLLAGLPALRTLGQPLLAGLSRKGFLGHTLRAFHAGKDAPAEARGPATLAAVTAAVLGGASLVRVHDVRPAAEAVGIADAVLAAAEYA